MDPELRDQLVAMGFDGAKAASALARCGNDVGAAMDMLLAEDAAKQAEDEERRAARLVQQLINDARPPPPVAQHAPDDEAESDDAQVVKLLTGVDAEASQAFQSWCDLQRSSPTGTLDLREWEQLPPSAENVGTLVALLLAPTLSGLREVVLTLMRWHDDDLASVLAVVPRAHLRRLHVASLQSASCPMTASVLQDVLQSCPQLVDVALVMEPLAAALAPSPMHHLTRLTLVSRLCCSDAWAKALRGAPLQSLSVAAIVRPDETETFLCQVLTACASTLTELSIALAPSLRNLPNVGEALRACTRVTKLRWYGLVGTGTAEDVEQLLGPVLSGNAAILRELVLTTRYRSFALFARRDRIFPVLEVLKVFNARRLSPAHLADVCRALGSGAHLRELVLESSRRFEREPLLTPEVLSQICSFKRLERLSLLTSAPCNMFSLVERIAELPNLVHLGVTLVGLNGTFGSELPGIPRRLVSLDVVADDDAVTLLAHLPHLDQLTRFRLSGPADDEEALELLGLRLHRCPSVWCYPTEDTVPLLRAVLRTSPLLREFHGFLALDLLGVKLHWNTAVGPVYSEIMRQVGISERSSWVASETGVRTDELPFAPIFYSALNTMTHPFDRARALNDSDDSDSGDGDDDLGWKYFRNMGQRVLHPYSDESSVVAQVKRFAFIERHCHTRAVGRLRARAALFEMGKAFLRMAIPKDLRILIGKLLWTAMLNGSM